jgi:hypothetical protein
MNPCSNIVRNNRRIVVDERTMRCEDYPMDHDGNTLRPNVLMLVDHSFSFNRELIQATDRNEWISNHKGKKIVVIEIGAGTVIPSIRGFCGSFARNNDCSFIRINKDPHDAKNSQGIGIADTALGALDSISRFL